MTHFLETAMNMSAGTETCLDTWRDIRRDIRRTASYFDHSSAISQS